MHFIMPKMILIYLGLTAFILFNGGYLEAASYAPSQLIVKLKPGKTLVELRELNLKYRVTASEKVFKETLSPGEKLRELRKQRVAAKSREEISNLEKQIQIQEKIVSRIKR